MFLGLKYWFYFSDYRFISDSIPMNATNFYCQSKDAIVSGGIPGSEPFEKPKKGIKYQTDIHQILSRVSPR